MLLLLLPLPLLFPGTAEVAATTSGAGGEAAAAAPPPPPPPSSAEEAARTEAEPFGFFRSGFERGGMSHSKYEQKCGDQT